MPLDYEQFSVRSVRVDLLLLPGCDHGYNPGELSALYGRLNEDDLFESCELRANLGARFDSESWTMDISQTRLWIRGRSHLGGPDVASQIKALLRATREHLGANRLSFIFADEVYVSAVVPGRNKANVSQMVMGKLLKKLSPERTSLLTGLIGAGVRFNGDMDDETHWHFMVEPSHAAGYSQLQLAAEFYFRPRPQAGNDDLDLIGEQIETAYHFLNSNAKSFAQAVLP